MKSLSTIVMCVILLVMATSSCAKSNIRSNNHGHLEQYEQDEFKYPNVFSPQPGVIIYAKGDILNSKEKDKVDEATDSNDNEDDTYDEIKVETDANSDDQQSNDLPSFAKKSKWLKSKSNSSNKWGDFSTWMKNNSRKWGDFSTWLKNI